MDTSITITSVKPLYPQTPQRHADGKEAASAEDKKASDPVKQPMQLTQDEIRLVEQLKSRDREVKAHEQAHKAIAGQYARGAPSYDYQIGPDGRRYAVGGEVGIDISKESTPEKTLQKAQVIRRAAMAPADPSGQDRQIAMRAATMAAEARQEMLQQEQEATETKTASSQQQSDNAIADAGQKTPTATERRAIASITRVVISGLETRQNPFDQFI